MLKNRLLEIDFTRAIAIVLMVFTHTAIFFYDFGNQFASSISDLGGFVCFSIFLFDSGAVLPPMLAKHSGRTIATKMFWRGMKLLVVYLLFAIVVGGIDKILPILTLQEIPIFADFIIAFVLFFFVGAGLALVVNDKPRALVALVISIVLSLLGFWLYHYQVSDLFQPVKALLVGDSELHRFPILQYSVIYVAGIAYAFWRDKFNLSRYFYAFVLLLVATYLAIGDWGFSRWEASPGFIYYGLTVTFLLMLSWEIFKLIFDFESKQAQHLISLVVNVSNAAFGILLWHVFILVPISGLVEQRFNYAITLLVFIGVLAASYILGKKLKL